MCQSFLLIVTVFLSALMVSREKMGCLEQKLWIWTLLLSGVLADPEPYSVVYPGPICAVTGSTVTIPCTYSYPKEAIDKRVRVVWCIDHEICQGSTPTIYDSAIDRNDQRYTYIGDKKNNCSLKIKNVNKTNTKTYRFRMETSIPGGLFTGRSGVNITVVEPGEMTVINPRGNNLVRRSDNVTLTCRTLGDCSTDQLAITWYHDNQTLPENGPSLHLNPVTTSDSGEYSCALKNSLLSHSQSFYLSVDNNTGPSHTTLVVAIVIGVLVGVIILAVLCFIHRRRVLSHKERTLQTVQPSDTIYSNTSEDAGQHRLDAQEVAMSKEEVNYSSFNFKPLPGPGKRVNAEEPVIYSAISSPEKRVHAEEPAIYSAISRVQ